ncbi:MAG: helix-turn-helix transcriptional regulator [Lachnospiraceae bacterium]|nr:helix-turn-helix transcriptional regulator [Lachnospiraceae bacterium]
MAEFGENLKRIREEKGYTQQTLADKLFVTRQAVSRWEGGSRYPDLMTAKKMSQFLEVSLDDLLSDEDMKQYPERNAIMDNAVAKQLQVILIAIAFMSSLALSIIYLSNYFICDTYVISAESEMFKCILLTIVLGFGIHAALNDKINSRMAVWIATLFLGTGIVSAIILLINNFKFPVILQDNSFTMVYLVGSLFLNVLFLISCIRFFCSKKKISPLLIYCFSALYAAIGIINFLISRLSDFPKEIQKDLFLINIFGLLEGLVLLILLVSMAYVLDRKRKLAAA